MDFKSMFADFKQIREPAKNSVEKIDYDTKFSEFENFKCPYCKESSVLIEDGSFVCTSCGKENGIVISDKQEWRSYTESYNNVDSSRCGMPSNPLLPQSSLGTVATGNVNFGFSRLQTQNAMPFNERPILFAIKLIKKAAQSIDISGVLSDMACYLYVKLTENIKVKKGKVRIALMAYCQYVICKHKESNCYVSAEELSIAYDITMKKFNEAIKLFSDYSFYKTKCNNVEKKWNTKLIDSRNNFVKPTDPENIIRNVFKNIEFNDNDIANIIYIARNVKKLGIISSKMPQSIAAGCILLYVKEKGLKHIKINMISANCNVSDTTSNNIYAEIKNYKEFLFPKDLHDLYSGSVGDCMPEVDLSKIYTAPSRALPPSVIIDIGVKKSVNSRGRPKKIKPVETLT